MTADGSWETSPPLEWNYMNFLFFSLPLFIHLPSSGKPRVTHPTNRPVTLGFVQMQSYVSDMTSRTRQRSSFDQIYLLL